MIILIHDLMILKAQLHQSRLVFSVSCTTNTNKNIYTQYNNTIHNKHNASSKQYNNKNIHDIITKITNDNTVVWKYFVVKKFLWVMKPRKFITQKNLT